MDENEKKNVKIRRDGRCKAEEELIAQHLRAKKMKLTEQAVLLYKRQIDEIIGRNEILLFTNARVKRTRR